MLVKNDLNGQKALQLFQLKTDPTLMDLKEQNGKNFQKEKKKNFFIALRNL